MKGIVLYAALMFALGCPPMYGHDLQYTVSPGEAIVVKVFFSDNTAFSYERYEIFHEGEEIPFQVGRTDGKGRVVFAPDRSGAWRIKIFSEDGHGMDISIETDDQMLLLDEDRPLYERYSRIIVGIAIIFGIFGTISLFFGRKSR